MPQKNTLKSDNKMLCICRDTSTAYAQVVAIESSAEDGSEAYHLPPSCELDKQDD